MAKAKTAPVAPAAPAAAPSTTKKKTTAAADLLGQLSDLVPSKKAPKAGAKQEWIVTLEGNDAQTFSRWIEAKMVADVVDTRLNSSKDELGEIAFEKIADSMWKSKTKPLNPVLHVKKADGALDSKAVYLFQDKFKYRFPEVPEGTDPAEHFVKVFVDLGLEQADAERLVEDELDLNPIVGLRPLTELTSGSYGEKRQFIPATAEEMEAGRKLMSYLTSQPDADGNCTVEALTPAERAILIKRDAGIKVKSGFYSRVCGYCHSVDQLKAVFKVIVPIAYPAYQKFAINDGPESRSSRLIAAAANIIGVNVVDGADTDE